MPKRYPFAVRRFAKRGARPDCFEVYDTRNGECASFGAFKFQAEQIARTKNADYRARGWYQEPTQPLKV